MGDRDRRVRHVRYERQLRRRGASADLGHGAAPRHEAWVAATSRASSIGRVKRLPIADVDEHRVAVTSRVPAEASASRVPQSSIEMDPTLPPCPLPSWPASSSFAGIAWADKAQIQLQLEPDAQAAASRHSARIAQSVGTQPPAGPAGWTSRTTRRRCRARTSTRSSPASFWMAPPRLAASNPVGLQITSLPQVLATPAVVAIDSATDGSSTRACFRACARDSP